jgi:hypothetical protein
MFMRLMAYPEGVAQSCFWAFTPFDMLNEDKLK